jgi:hypothetical protein
MANIDSKTMQTVRITITINWRIKVMPKNSGNNEKNVNVGGRN